MINSKLRWQKELELALKQGEGYFKIINLNQAFETQRAEIILYGAPGTPYEGYGFLLEYQALDCPWKPPKVRFIDIPWSPFVCPKSGKICCDILGNQWHPVMTLQIVVISIISLLSQTSIYDSEDPGLNIEATAQMKYKFSTFFIHAREQAQKHHSIKRDIFQKLEKANSFYPKDLLNEKQFLKAKECFTNDSVKIQMSKQKKDQNNRFPVVNPIKLRKKTGTKIINLEFQLDPKV